MSRGAVTRARILEAALQELRTTAPERLSVASLMRKVRLTHGGFYLHFESKSALVEEALRAAFGRAREAGDPALLPLPALASARGGERELRRVCGEELSAMAGDDEALAKLALAVGAELIAGAIDDPVLAQRVRASTRRLAEPPEIRPRPRGRKPHLRLRDLRL